MDVLMTKSFTPFILRHGSSPLSNFSTGKKRVSRMQTHSIFWGNLDRGEPANARFLLLRRCDPLMRTLPRTRPNHKHSTQGHRVPHLSAARDGQAGNTVDLQAETSSKVDESTDEAVLPAGWKWNRSSTELIAYGMLLGAVPIVPLLPRFEYSAPFYFFFLAVWTVYVGSHRSLNQKPTQEMSFKQGLAVPILCSVSLFGFYCLLRFFPEINLRSFISVYLSLVGAMAVASNFVQPIRLLFSDRNTFSRRIELPTWLVQDDSSPAHFDVTLADVTAGFVGIAATVASKQAGAPFTINNLIAVCIATELLQLLSVGSFLTATAMLGGLLIYDVFWVFGSSHLFGDNVMVTVATSEAFDGPVKLIFPQFRANAVNPYSILGLGDIAAPGLLVALMLRFDRFRSSKTAPVGIAGTDLMQSPDKTYFVSCLSLYVFGLGLTVAANAVSGAAQPALLYLVPSLLLGVFFVAASRSEASLLLDYKEEALTSAVAVREQDLSD